MISVTKHRLMASAIVMLMTIASVNLTMDLQQFSVRGIRRDTSHDEKSEPFRREVQEISSIADDQNHSSWVVDIISVGSLSRQGLQDAQERTFGRHETVRNFYRFTEENDTDQDCVNELTSKEVTDVTEFCRNLTTSFSLVARRLRAYLSFDSHAEGWVCAQKRPIDGLYSVLMKYQDGEIDTPHYLFLIDDDTYINVDSLNEILFHDFPYNDPQLLTGCDIPVMPKYKMSIPYGGFGSFLSRAAIQRLLRPIYCNKTNSNYVIADSFSRFACWRLRENQVGENAFFSDGMSVMDLMYQYAADQPFREARNWDVGFCFHSDIALGYFLNMYHIAVPYNELDANVRVTDMLRKQYRYQPLNNKTSHSKHPHWQGECALEKICTADSPVCHYIQASQMDELLNGTDVA